MKRIIIALLATAGFALVAAPVGPERVFENRKERASAPNEHFLREEGGFLDYIPEGPKVVVADFRTESKDGVAEHVASTVRGMYKLVSTNIALSVKSDSREEAVALRKSLKALMVLAISDSGPSLAVYPEDRIALVGANAATEYTKSDKEAKVRLIKELWRGFGFIVGAGYAQNASSVMQPVGTPLELDMVEWQVVHPMAITQMRRFFKVFGAKQGRRSTYRAACEEGWAPAPTNDYQRAIFEAVKTNKADTVSSPAATPPAK